LVLGRDFAEFKLKTKKIDEKWLCNFGYFGTCGEIKATEQSFKGRDAPKTPLNVSINVFTNKKMQKYLCGNGWCL
jgi:hypothetical protein